MINFVISFKQLNTDQIMVAHVTANTGIEAFEKIKEKYPKATTMAIDESWHLKQERIYS